MQDLGVEKIGHLKRIQNAIQLLKDSNMGTLKSRDIRSTETESGESTRRSCDMKTVTVE